jgi:hypothetical protein
VTASNPTRHQPPRLLTVAVFVISLILYLALAAWMTQTWKPLGDEPHYLLAADSIAFDHDLDLTNNYARGDYRAFLAGDTLDPHVKLTASGQEILNHDLGLAFAIAPAYAVGGRAAVEYFLAIIAAFLVTEIFLLAFDVTASMLASLIAWAALAFTPPLVMYATLIYPELIGALIVSWSARTLLFKSPAQISTARLIVLMLGFAALPWLSARFFIVLALLLIFVGVQWFATPRRVLIVYTLSALAIIFYGGVNYVLLAGSAPGTNSLVAGTVSLGNQTIASTLRGLIGWWIDPQRGTLILAPIYLLALAGVPRLLVKDFRAGGALVLPLAVINLLIPLVGGFWIPFEVGARYFVIALPLLAAPLALMLQAGLQFFARSRRVQFAVLLVALGALSVWNGLLMIQDASFAYGSVVTAYSQVLGMDVSPLFAAMGSPVLLTPQTSDNTIVNSDDEAMWHADAGAPQTILPAYNLTDLSNGNYNLAFRASAKNISSENDVLTLDIFSAEGLPIVHTTWRAADFAQHDSLQPFVINFDNPYYEHWVLPLIVQMTTSGNADVSLGVLLFNPDTFITWLRIGIWVALVFGLILVLNLDLLRRRKLEAS